MAVSSNPKAYLNILFFDERFKFVEQGSEVVPIDIKGAWSSLQRVLSNAKEAQKSGYVYIYVSNESNNLVYFDNFQVTHERGPLLEETHYYPFGLAMSGISSKALGFGGAENKHKYNKGTELQSKEFSDDSGLECYATNFRNLDPQLGKWWQMDPKPDYTQSLYSAMGNNPILYNDPLGDTLSPPKVPFKYAPNSQQSSSQTNTKSKNGTWPGSNDTTPYNSNSSTNKTKNKASGAKTNGTGANKPVVGFTTTNKITKETDIVNTHVGDKITLSSYSGQVNGQDGSVVTLDGSTNTVQNTNVDGGSISLLGVVTIGYGTDRSVTVGIGAFGYEGHVGVNLTDGVGLSAGGSHTSKSGNVNGGDVKVSAGLYSLGVAVIVATGGLGAFAF
jgi:RHS repeat-associated protein